MRGGGRGAQKKVRGKNSTRHGQVPDHVVPPREEVPRLQALVLAAQDGREVLVGEVVERAGVLEGLVQSRAGLGVAAHDLLALGTAALIVYDRWHC